MHSERNAHALDRRCLARSNSGNRVIHHRHGAPNESSCCTARKILKYWTRRVDAVPEAIVRSVHAFDDCLVGIAAIKSALTVSLIQVTPDSFSAASCMIKSDRLFDRWIHKYIAISLENWTCRRRNRPSANDVTASHSFDVCEKCDVRLGYHHVLWRSFSKAFSFD